MNKPKNKFIEELAKDIPGRNRFTEQLEKATVDADYKMMQDYLGEYFDKRDLDHIMDTLADDYDRALTEAAISAATSSISGGTSSQGITKGSHSGDASQYYSNPSYQYVPPGNGAKGKSGVAIGDYSLGGINVGNGNTWVVNDPSAYKTTITADEIMVDGMSLKDVLNKMQERMAILDDPSPEKLEKFEALKKAYENYKILEKLCFEKGDDEK